MKKLNITKKLINEFIAYNKAEYNEDQTEAEAVEEITRLHNLGCQVEYSGDCMTCPLYNTGKCPL